ncbi:MAG: ATP-binding cassette domain-containing protein [Ilumatobacteraceae bacterium]
MRLSIRDLTALGDRGQLALDVAALDIREGEILGLAGVSGNGQRELAEVLAGLRPAQTGVVEVDGTSLLGRGPKQVQAAGLGYVPEERMRDGAISSFSVAENLLLIDHGSEPFARRGLLQRAAIASHSKQLVDRFVVKTPTTDTPIGQLSGGNIQKVIVARDSPATPRSSSRRSRPAASTSERLSTSRPS